MFNTYITKTGRDSIVPYEKTVTEIKAPTDDSIKLYEEIKEKAFKSILSVWKIKDNLIEAEICFFANKCTIEQEVLLIYKLNGKEFIKHIVTPRKVHFNANEWIRKVYECIFESFKESLCKSVGGALHNEIYKR